MNLDFQTAKNARFQNGMTADRFMTRIRLLLQEAGNQKDRPMSDSQREELRKLRWCLAEAIDNVLEDDMRLYKASLPSQSVRRIQNIVSAFDLAEEGKEICAADAEHQYRMIRGRIAQ